MFYVPQVQVEVWPTCNLVCLTSAHVYSLSFKHSPPTLDSWFHCYEWTAYSLVNLRSTFLPLDLCMCRSLPLYQANLYHVLISESFPLLPEGRLHLEAPSVWFYNTILLPWFITSYLTNTYHIVLSSPVYLSEQNMGSLKGLCLIHLCVFNV